MAFLPPPEPAPALWTEVANGRVGVSTPTNGGVVAWGVLPLSRDLAWLTLTDDHLSDAVSGLTEVVLRGRGSTPKLLYQRIDLPWPFVDRHWILNLSNNEALAVASGTWERSWRVDNGELPSARARTDPTEFDASQTVAINRGAWLLVPLDASHTLAVYQAATVLEGNIPAAAADSWTRSSLDDLYAGLGRHAVAVAARYGAGCAPQPGADGSLIACF